MEGKDKSRPLSAFRSGAVLASHIYHSRGEIYSYLPRTHTEGSVSIDGRSFGDPDCLKERPLLIVSRDELNKGDTVLAVPFYSQQLEKRRKYKNCVFFAAGEFNLHKDCVAKCDEIAVYDRLELGDKIGRIDAAKMELIVDAVRYSIRDSSLT